MPTGQAKIRHQFDAEFVALLGVRAERQQDLRNEGLAEWLINKGSNPFRVWSHVRQLDRTYIKNTLGVEEFDITNFEHGIFDDLSVANVASFCKLAKIHPVDLLAPDQPMPPAVLETLFGIIENPKKHSALSVEKSCYALMEQAEDAGIRLANESFANNHDEHLLVRQFLRIMRANDGGAIDVAEVRLPQPEIFERDVLLPAFESEARANSKQTADENTKLSATIRSNLRLVSDYTLRLFDIDANTFTDRMDYLVSLFPPKEFIPHFRRDPEIAGPMIWPEGGSAQFIGSRLMCREQAIDGLADLYCELAAKQELRVANMKDCKVMAGQIQTLNDWAEKNDGLFSWYRNRQLIMAHKRQHGWEPGEVPPMPRTARLLDTCLSRFAAGREASRMLDEAVASHGRAQITQKNRL